MAIFIVQLGTPRRPDEGVRLGTVRRPPRGVPKSDFARLDYYDVWFPNLSPSPELVREALGAADDREWAAFPATDFRREMSARSGRELDVRGAFTTSIFRWDATFTTRALPQVRRRANSSRARGEVV
jgi:uncharacterized protein YeaO (DUF488 family)